MSRPVRISLIVGGALLGLLLILAVAAVVVARSEWFRNMVRERIVREVETSTGGTVEIASFSFDWRRLRAEVKDFVIHGAEPPGSPPLFRARSVEVVLKIISPLKRDVDIAYLGVQEPQVYLLVDRDGRTNLPEPKAKRRTDKNPVETVVDLAIGRFQIDNGAIHFESQKTPLNASGENLRAQFLYELLGTRYRGELSIEPLYVDWAGKRPLPVNLKIPVVVDENRVEVSNARLQGPESGIELSGVMEDFAAPRGSVHLQAGLMLRELAPYLGDSFRTAPAQKLTADVRVGLEKGRVQIAGARLELGASRVDASGAIDNLDKPQGSLRFTAKLFVTELGRIFRVEGHPEGTVQIAGDARFTGAEDYSVKANLVAKELAFQQGARRLAGIEAVSALVADSRRIELNGLRVAALGGTFTGRAAIQNMARFRVDGVAKNFALRDLARANGAQPVAWDGIVSGPVRVEGSLRGSDLRAGTRLEITPGTRGVPLSGRIDANYDRRREILNLDSSYLATPATRVDFSGSLGQQIRVRLASKNLDDLLPAIALASPKGPKSFPIALKNGVAVFDATITGTLTNPAVDGRVSLTSFAFQNQVFDRFATEVHLEKSRADVRKAVLAQGTMQAQLDGSIALREWKPEEGSAISAQASVQGADLGKISAMAGQKKPPVTGALRAAAKVEGTVDDPRATADVTIVKGLAYEEPFDRFQAGIRYSNRLVELTSAQLTAGSARIDMSGSFQHPPKNFQTGEVRVHVKSNTIPLQQLQTLQKRRSGLTGSLQLAVDGAAALQSGKGQPRFLLSDLNANIATRDLTLDEKRVGNLVATAETQGSDLAFKLQSDFANSDVRGDGKWRLAGDYPLTAQVTFSPLQLSYLRTLFTRPGAAQRSDFDGVVEGRVEIAGPALKPENLKGSLRLARLELANRPVAQDGVARQAISLKNPEPIVITLDRSTIRVESARLAGNGTDFAVSGTVALQKDRTTDIQFRGGIGLEVVEIFSPDLFASGSIAVNADVKGPVKQPVINGRVQLKNASLSMADLPNGISNANGVIAFNRTQAVIQNLTAETGGGKVALGGFVGYGGPELQFRVNADAKQIRVRYPEGASTLLNASLNVAGGTGRSLLSGTVTILQINFQPRTDFASMLAKSAQPTRTETARTGVLGGMQFDVHIMTAPETRFQTNMALDIQADANLRLRGTPSRPAMLGRINITQGEIVFLGNKYTIGQGTLAFYDPQRIEPVVNIDLETKARGIAVILTVSGPMNKLQVTHRSDPPLPFSEIVALLATGKAPTSDPALAGRQAAEPQQNWQQMGASYLGRAIANPVAGRLQRLFGVTKLKFDPTIAGAENTPQARLTLEQQVSSDLTFSYIQNVSQSNSQIVRVEWAFSKVWSVIALREENGRVGLDFQYKKRLK